MRRWSTTARVPSVGPSPGPAATASTSAAMPSWSTASADTCSWAWRSGRVIAEGTTGAITRWTWAGVARVVSPAPDHSAPRVIRIAAPAAPTEPPTSSTVPRARLSAAASSRGGAPAAASTAVQVRPASSVAGGA